MAAILLARHVYGQEIEWLCGGPGFWNPALETIFPSATQFEAGTGAQATLPYEEIALLFEQGAFDMGFFGGLEIDGSGRVNLGVTESGIEGPGPAGLPVGLSRVRQAFLLAPRHQPSSLVARVHYASGVPRGNVAALLTPLCVFDLQGDVPVLVENLGRSVDEIRERTGFTFTVAADAGDLRPTDDEVDLLARVDPGGILSK
ncbi:hypothetical protein ABZ848_49075 [Streptomyces sp. NPDC047081]|uniref:hypothetical protein n=1 Tax=Streptomyces sp. NPDC047081 TaxID=3154706 RepID=UPI0033FB7216